MPTSWLCQMSYGLPINGQLLTWQESLLNSWSRWPQSVPDLWVQHLANLPKALSTFSTRLACSDSSTKGRAVFVNQ